MITLIYDNKNICGICVIILNLHYYFLSQLEPFDVLYILIYTLRLKNDYADYTDV
jgi:hypothetical protein